MSNLLQRFLITLLLSLLAGLLPTQTAGAKNHKPTLAQIEAARQAEIQKRKIAEEAAKTLLKARENLKQLTALTNQAQARYVLAKRELAQANIVLAESVRQYELAVAAVPFTNREIGKLAVNAYVSGGGLSDIEATPSDYHRGCGRSKTRSSGCRR